MTARPPRAPLPLAARILDRHEEEVALRPPWTAGLGPPLAA
ncbi:hypothetical protein ACIRVF_36760 [Kitasatospora sp. NPDC101157]